MPRFIGRYKAQLENKTRYFTGAGCVRGHRDERRVSDTQCVECAREDMRRRKKTPKGREAVKAQKRRHYQRHKARLIAQSTAGQKQARARG